MIKTLLKSNQAVSKQKGLFSFAELVRQQEAAKTIVADTAADRTMRTATGDIWRHASEAEKDSIYNYTHSFRHINDPMRGYQDGKFVGVGKVPISETTRHEIEDITDLLNHSSYSQDLDLFRGYNISSDRMDKFFRVPSDMLRNAPEADLNKALQNRVVTDHGFFSTTAVEGKGFSDYPVNMRVHVPKGTHAMYLEPFSSHGEGAGRAWDGISKQQYFGDEMEVLLQRDSSFKIDSVHRDKTGKLFVDMSLIRQHPRKI